jgi:6,7-dimethyl-8-ribityllumazine synthase
MRTEAEHIQSIDGTGLRIALIVSRFNPSVTESLLDGARDYLLEIGVTEADIDITRVPGAFELPLAAKAATHNAHGVVCLGCVIQGDTPHFTFICDAVAHGLTHVSLETDTPVGFGLLTTNTLEQALERSAPGPANKGREAAAAVVELCWTLKQ